MKKLVFFILTILYIGSATGATVNLHYCMGEFAGWELGHADDGECSSCGMDKSATGDEDCCKDEQKTIKLSDAHKSAQLFFEMSQVSPAVPLLFHQIESGTFPTITESYPLINAPPPKLSSAVFLYIRSIRI